MRKSGDFETTYLHLYSNNQIQARAHGELQPQAKVCLLIGGTFLIISFLKVWSEILLPISYENELIPSNLSKKGLKDQIYNILDLVSY